MMVTSHVCSQCGATIAAADPSTAGAALCANCRQSAAPPVLAESVGAASGRSMGWRIWVILLVSLIAILLFCVLAPILVQLYLPMTAIMRETQQRQQCAANFEQIAAALDAYKLKFGAWPPSYLADGAGRPAHSWRVLLLPFYSIEEYENLYKEYSFDEPWDGPNNRNLHDRMPEFYGCPSDPDTFGGQTSYLALTTTGATTIGATPLGLRSPNLDPAAQILVVEVVGSGVTWTEPADMDVGQLAASVNDPSGRGIASFHLDGAHVLEDDGDVTLLEDGDTGPGPSPPTAPAGVVDSASSPEESGEP